MSEKVFINRAHLQQGYTCLAFGRDGSRVYTGGADSLVRIWNTAIGTDQDPVTVVEASDGVTSLSTGDELWVSGSGDSQALQFPQGKTEAQASITNAAGVPIRCVAVDPKTEWVAVTSDEPRVKLVNIEETTNMKVLTGHTKAVRKATWHPSGSLLTTCGADGQIIVWDVSVEEPKQVTTIEGVIPEVSDSLSPEFLHDCSAVWHGSGQFFFIATKNHEIVTIARSNWSRSATFSDPASMGAVTALAVSRNGTYLASASKSGIFIWSTQSRRMLYRFQGAVNVPVTQLAFSPSQNMLAWTNTDGELVRWHDPIPLTAPDPVKAVNVASDAAVSARRQATPTLFDQDPTDAEMNGVGEGQMDGNDDVDAELDNDDWILDDLGDGMVDDDKMWTAKDGVREMVSITKAQPAFQPGSTPMENKKRYLAYNMIGVIEVTDQDTHHIVNVEFHDRSARKSYHFTDHFKYNLACLGERGAIYACQPENDHPARVTYKPYSSWANQGEWSYDLPTGTKVLGVAAGGSPPTKSLRIKSDTDVQGNGNVVVATSDGELLFITGGGVERHCLSLQGDFVSMVAGPEWVFIVHREGSTTIDGSQNLTGRLIKFEDFCLLQKDSLPIPKGRTLTWIGITEEGAPAIYDSSGVLNVVPRFRVPFAATWTRALNTNVLARREGKQESYWPVGVSGETFMCLILKGRQEHPGFPRPLIQELPLQFPFKRVDTKDGQLEEHLARETMLLDIIRDGLGDELTTDDIARRELSLDKEIIQLIQSACKADRLARAIDLTKLLHHNASFEMAIKVAHFYHLLGLQEKIEMLRDEREGVDRLETAREKRKERARDLAAVPPPRTHIYEDNSRPKPFQDFRPPPQIHRPGLERAQVGTPGPSRTPATLVASSQASAATSSLAMGDSQFGQDGDSMDTSRDGKRKRAEEKEGDVPRGGGDGGGGADSTGGTKRRALGEPSSISTGAQARSNPFARKPGEDNNRSNPFTRPLESKKSLHKSESFFQKVDAAEADKTRRPTAKGKGREKENKESGGRQTTLFGLVAPVEGKSAGKKKGNNEDSQESTVVCDSQMSSTTVSDETQEAAEDVHSGLVETQETTQQLDVDDGEDPIDWPASPVAMLDDEEDGS